MTGFKNSALINGETIYNGQAVAHSAGNSITVINEQILSGGAASFTAKTAVQAKTEFHALYGSSSRLFTSNTFPECSDMTDFQKIGVTDSSIPREYERRDQGKIIEISFRPKSNFLANFYITPNPTTGLFTLEYSFREEIASKFLIQVFDFAGNLVYSETSDKSRIVINLSKLSQGITSVQNKF